MSYNTQLIEQINYIPQVLSSLVPLTITPVSYVQHNSQDSTQWSPFSAPSFSPYDINTNSSSPKTNYFQYSCYSPCVKPSTPKNLPKPIGTGRVTAGYTDEQRNFWQNHQQNHCSEKQRLPKRSDQVDMTDYIRQATIQRALGGRVKSCSFCKTNGEPERIYTSHSLKDSADKITCPVLMQYVCPDCGATGEKTHTKKYCPVLQKRLRNEMLNKMARRS